jgi:S-DNA-T family DNA segregation ATPase FtsK/SpoIIIE
MKTDRGTCVAVGVSDAPFELIRTFYVPFEDGRDDVTPVIARAMAGIAQLRRTGAPTAAIDAPVDHLADIWEALSGTRDPLRDILPRLRERDPSVYGTWNQARLAAFLDAEDVPVKHLDGYKVIYAESVQQALQRRQVADPDGGPDA